MSSGNWTVFRGRAPSVLVIAYAFPPIQVQMSPVAARFSAGFHKLGFAVDVIAAHPDASSAPLPHDDSLLSYVNAHCRRIQRLHPNPSLTGRLAKHVRLVRDFPDCMARLHRAAFEAVMATEPWTYNAVLSLSPFHSVNPVMTQVKRLRPDVKWIAHFCDPWSNNPLERRRLARAWNMWHEPQALHAATYVTHSSPHALEVVRSAYPFVEPDRTRLVPHVFDPALYPSRAKRRNDKVTLRFVGTLFARRSPTPLFLALGRLIERRPELRDAVRLELVGPMDRKLPEWDGFVALPAGLVCHRPTVRYLESLELMYDADLLLIIEADVAATPFVPSKVMDYMGANTPIIGIAPPGGCGDLLDRLDCLSSTPEDVSGIAAALEIGIDRVISGCPSTWCNDDVRTSFDVTNGTAAFLPLIMEDRTE